MIQGEVGQLCYVIKDSETQIFVLCFVLNETVCSCILFKQVHNGLLFVSLITRKYCPQVV